MGYSPGRPTAGSWGVRESRLAGMPRRQGRALDGGRSERGNEVQVTDFTGQLSQSMGRRVTAWPTDGRQGTRALDPRGLVREHGEPEQAMAHCTCPAGLAVTAEGMAATGADGAGGGWGRPQALAEARKEALSVIGVQSTGHQQVPGSEVRRR